MPSNDVSKLIKFTKNHLVNPDNEPGTEMYHEYVAGFKQRMYDMTKTLFQNEPDLL